MKMRFGDNWSLSSKKISDILNQIYNIELKQYKKGAKVPTVGTLFYRNICPTGGTFDKKTNINTIKNKIELLDIKSEIGISETDLSIERSIDKRKAKILNNLDDTEKEILLEGVF